MPKPKTFVGICDCSECGSEQKLMKDGGGKHYIHCTECKTFSNYQAKTAYERVLLRVKKPSTEPTEAEDITDTPTETEPSITAEKADRKSGFFATLGGAK